MIPREHFFFFRLQFCRTRVKNKLVPIFYKTKAVTKVKISDTIDPTSLQLEHPTLMNLHK